jgi:hypothetical protein
MTERERIALLDFCTQKFQSEYCFVGKAWIEPPIRRVPLIPEKRSWAGIGFSGFKKAVPVEDGEEFRWISQIIGQRSDGQMFCVYCTLPIDFEPEGHGVAWVMGKITKAYDKFQTYKDCSCGTLDQDESEEVYRVIHSPCSLHPPINETES